MSRFPVDKLENEKRDPTESSNLRFVNVPLLLLAVFWGFGIGYLVNTDRVTMSEGDSRTRAAGAAPAVPGDGGGADEASVLARGERVFTTSCQACHQADGQGVPGAFPPLAGSEWVAGPAARVVAILLHGIDGEITVRGQKFRGLMPAFREQLPPGEIAAVAAYVRRRFGNKPDLIAPDLVERVKKATQSQGGPWAGEAALNARKWE